MNVAYAQMKAGTKHMPANYGMKGKIMNRTWTKKEDEIIRENYPDEGVMFVTKLLHSAGFSDRDYLSVQREASKLEVKRIGKRRKDRLVKS